MKIKIKTIALAILAAITFASCGKQNGENLSPTYSASDAEIWCAPSSVKVLATQSKETYANERTNGVQLSAAKNEYESAQIIVSAKNDLFFTVEAGELTNVADSSKKIGKENCTVYTQKYITVTKNWHKNGAPTGDYPDAILPQENGRRLRRGPCRETLERFAGGIPAPPAEQPLLCCRSGGKRP